MVIGPHAARSELQLQLYRAGRHKARTLSSSVARGQVAAAAAASAWFAAWHSCWSLLRPHLARPAPLTFTPPLLPGRPPPRPAQGSGPQLQRHPRRRDDGGGGGAAGRGPHRHPGRVQLAGEGDGAHEGGREGGIRGLWVEAAARGTRCGAQPQLSARLLFYTHTYRPLHSRCRYHAWPAARRSHRRNTHTHMLHTPRTHAAAGHRRGADQAGGHRGGGPRLLRHHAPQGGAPATLCGTAPPTQRNTRRTRRAQPACGDDTGPRHPFVPPCFTNPLLTAAAWPPRHPHLAPPHVPLHLPSA